MFFNTSYQEPIKWSLHLHTSPWSQQNGRVHFAVFENLQVLIYSKLQEKIMWLLINNKHEKLTKTRNCDRACFFLVHSTEWLKQITTFVKLKLLQNRHF